MIGVSEARMQSMSQINQRFGRQEIATLVILAVWLLFNVLTLTKYPVPMCDEANYAVVGYQFARHGVFTAPIHGVGDSDALNAATVGRLWAVGQAMLFWAFGVSLYAARLYNVFAWIGCVVLVYAIARRLHNHHFGLLSALTFGFSVWVLMRWRLARPDAWAALMLLAMFWAYLRLRDNPTFWKAFGLSLVGLLALDFYAAGPLFFIPIYGLLVLWDAYRRREWRNVIGFGVGAVVGVVLLVIARAYPDPAVAFQRWFGRTLNTHIQGVGGGEFQILVGLRWLWRNFVERYGLPLAVESVLTLAGIIIAIRERRQDEVTLLWVYLGGLVLFTLFYADKGWMHGAMWSPFMAMMITRVVWWVAGRLGALWSQFSQAALASVLLAPWLVLNAAGGVWLVASSWGSDWPGAIRAMRELIPPDSDIWAKESWWFGYPEARLVSQLGLRRWVNGDDDGIVTEAELVDFFHQNSVDYLILEDDFHCHALTLTPPSFTLQEAITRYCTEVGSIEGYFSEAEGVRTTTARAYQCRFGEGNHE
jgi:hypothetical protein